MQIREIPEQLAGKRLDQALAVVFPEYSRSRLKLWLEHGRIMVDGIQKRPRDKVKSGESVSVNPELDHSDTVQAEAIDLDIVHQDKHILVINKPAGLVVHPAAGNWSGTLQNGLLYFDPALSGIPRAGIVHRLDKETSGLMVVARTLEAHHSLVSQLQDKTVYREYHALVIGEMISGSTIEAAIGRHSTDRKRFAVRDNGKPAVTHYRVLEKFHQFTLLRVQLETGRTHQIRVHLAHIGYPLVGDPVYRGRLQVPKGAGEELKTILQQFQRQALHAAKLGIIHPETDQELSWAAEHPEDMQKLISIIRSNQ
ncbi:MAG: 23S rRNA pseudouridine(1911/1915/1917) synthase RluD [Gammaproteobacteria bacterium]|nr:23S rRNA pseudouridine(1911/1915/1917) synthase RluD [Gammaproteobacteria bacterium]